MLSPGKQKNGKPKDGLVLRVCGDDEAAGMTHRGYRRIIAEVTECYIKAYRQGARWMQCAEVGFLDRASSGKVKRGAREMPC